MLDCVCDLYSLACLRIEEVESARQLFQEIGPFEEIRMAYWFVSLLLQTFPAFREAPSAGDSGYHTHCGPS